MEKNETENTEEVVVENNKDTPKKQWKNLISDDRSFLKRISITILPSLMFVFTVLFFGPFEIYLKNRNSMSFSLSDFILPVSIFCIVALAALVLFVSIFKGQLFNYIVCFLFGVSLCSYLQGSFLNVNLGLLDGTAINWENYSKHSITNLLIWFLICLIPFLVLYFFRPAWKYFIRIISFTVIIIQLISIITLIPRAFKYTYKNENYYFSTKGEFDLSPEENTLVFVLDAAGGVVFDRMLEEYPETSTIFKDFTYYKNYGHLIQNTFYSVTNMLSGYDYNPNEPYEEYARKTFTNEYTTNFYNKMFETGYKFSAYTTPVTIRADLSAIKNSMDNISKADYTVNNKNLINRFMKLSLFRHLPHSMKAGFWTSDSDLKEVTKMNYSEDPPYYFNDPDFFIRFEQKDITLNHDGKAFKLYHLNGTHGPYIMNEKARLVTPGSVTQLQQTRGSFYILEQYLNKLKQLGIYDKCNILILADHGYDYNNPAAMFLSKKANEVNDEIKSSNAPIWQKDLIPTYLDLAGLDYSEFGKSIYDFKENEKRERTMSHWAKLDEFPDDGNYFNAMVEFRYTGSARDINYVTDTPDKKYYLKEPYM